MRSNAAALNTFLLLLTISMGILFVPAYSQTYKEEVVEDSLPKPKFPKTVYARIMPLGVYSGAGYFHDRVTQHIEIGNSFEVIDAGLVFGRTALRPDSLGNGTQYLEGKVTMNLCQVGIISNEMTIGAGGVFYSNEPLMLELSYTIYAQFWKHFGIGIITGYYDFSGNTTDTQHNVFGLYFRYGMLRGENGGLLNLGRMARSHSARAHSARRRK